MSVRLPITPMRQPSTLNGQANGRLAPHLLVPVGVGNALQEATAARSWRALFASMRAATGIDLRHVGHYRTYQEQVNLFLSRYEPVGYGTFVITPTSRRKTWEDGPRLGYPSKWWRKIRRSDGSYPATAASPGTSNHGWGLALDLAEEYDADPQPDPIRNQMVNWLVAHAGTYGISAELQSEPWHWRYVAGDAIPQATLAYEGGVKEPDYPLPTLKLGSRGHEVVKFQQHYNWWNCEGFAPVSVDGNFGPQTEKAMRAFQRGLGVPDDGVYGPVTAAKYREVLMALERGK